MIRIIHFIDRISIWTGKLASWLLLVLTAVVCYEVYMRYVLRQPTAWAYDAGYMLYGSLFILAGAYALARNAHIRGDVLFRLWPIKVQAGLELFLYIIFFVPAVGALIYAGYGFAEMSWRIGERSSYSPGGPPLYHFKSLIPIAGVLLALQGIAEMMRCIHCLRHGYFPDRIPDVEEIQFEILEEITEKGVPPQGVKP